MEPTGLKYNFKSKPWLHNGTSGWTFISLPEKVAKEIRTLLRSEEQGWGRLSATAKIGKTVWKTAIWFDTKSNTYLLPLKADVRKKEDVELDKFISVVIWI